MWVQCRYIFLCTLLSFQNLKNGLKTLLKYSGNIKKELDHLIWKREKSEGRQSLVNLGNAFTRTDMHWRLLRKHHCCVYAMVARSMVSHGWLGFFLNVFLKLPWLAFFLNSFIIGQVLQYHFLLKQCQIGAVFLRLF